MDKIKLVEQEFTKKEFPQFSVGDTVKVLSRIAEGDKIRLHPFEGVVIALKGSGLHKSFTVRKVSYGEGFEADIAVVNSSAISLPAAAPEVAAE